MGARRSAPWTGRTPLARSRTRNRAGRFRRTRRRIRQAEAGRWLGCKQPRSNADARLSGSPRSNRARRAGGRRETKAHTQAQGQEIGLTRCCGSERRQSSFAANSTPVMLAPMAMPTAAPIVMLLNKAKPSAPPMVTPQTHSNAELCVGVAHGEPPKHGYAQPIARQAPQGSNRGPFPSGVQLHAPGEFTLRKPASEKMRHR